MSMFGNIGGAFQRLFSRKRAAEATKHSETHILTALSPESTRLFAEPTARAQSHPGPWLKNAPPKGGHRYFGTRVDDDHIRLPSGAVYKTDPTGWRRVG